MSTSATQPGTTTKAGRSGKGLGIAAAALAVVIAAGFVFAVNQGNEVTNSGVQSELSGPAQIAADRHAERVRLYELAAQAEAESHPAFNIEKTKMELAGQVAAVNEHPGLNIEKTKMQLAGQVATVNEYPGLNPEKTRMEMLIDKLDEQVYVPSTEEPTELNQPEWDNRIP
ncbi:MAG: hypothetical protein ABWZ58_09905 [Acidimicrobiia bacterium]